MAGSMSISGIVSGVDWDSMIDSIIEAAQQPAMVKVNKRTNLVNKKSLFEEMKVSMQALQSSISPLKLPSTYKAKEIEIERIDKNGSSKGVLTATVNADAEVAVYDLKVEQIATAQTIRSNQITASKFSGVSNMPDSSTLYITAAGQRVGIDVTSNDSLQSLKSKINNQLKTQSTPIEVTASVVDNRLIIKSDNTGVGATTATETLTYNSKEINTLSDIYVEYPEDLSLKGSNGKTYTYNEDFQVVNGNEIRWMTETINENSVKNGDSYSATYEASGLDSFKIELTRGSSKNDTLNFSVNEINDESRFYITAPNYNEITGGTVDEDNFVTIKSGSKTLTFDDIIKDLFGDDGIDDLDDSEIAEVFNKAFVMKDGTKTYEYNIDFELYEDEETGSLAINWFGLSAPDDNSKLSITYYDNPNPDYDKYEYGTDFTIDGNTVKWTGNNIPSKGTTYYLNYFSGETIDSYGQVQQNILRLKSSDYGSISYNGDNYLSLSDIKDALKITSDLTDSVVNTIFNQSLKVSDNSKTYEYGTDYTLIDNGNGWAAFKWVNAPSDLSALTITFDNQPDGISTDKTGTAKSQNTILLEYDSGSNSYGGKNYLSYSDIRSYLNITSSTSDATVASRFNSYLKVTDASDSTKTYTYGTDYTISKTDSGWASINWLDGNTHDVSVNLDIPATMTIEGGTVADSTELYIMWIPYEDGLATLSHPQKSMTFKQLKDELGVSTTNLLQSDLNSMSETERNELIEKVNERIVITDSNGTTYKFGEDYFICGRGTALNSNNVDEKWPSFYWNNSSSKDEPNYSDLSLTFGINTTPITINGGSVNQQTALNIYDENNGTLSDSTGSYLSLSEIKSQIGITDSTSDDDIATLFDRYLTIADSTQTYSYGTDYTLESDGNGQAFIVWTDGNSRDTSNLTITFNNTGTHVQVDSADSSAESYDILLFEDSEGSSYDGSKYMTYSKFLEKLGFDSDDEPTEDEIHSAFNKYFTVTDNDDSSITYKIGEDFDFDFEESEANGFPVILWRMSDPGDVTFSYRNESDGGEVFEFDLSRNDTDSIRTTNASGSSPDQPTYEKFQAADKITITYADRTYYEGIDFDVVSDSVSSTNSLPNAAIKWRTTDKDGNDITWYQPDPSQYSQYTINLFDSNGDVSHTYTAFRSYQDTLDFSSMGFTNAKGTFSNVNFNGTDYELTDNASETLGVNVTGYTDADGSILKSFNWTAPNKTANTNLPTYGTTITAEYAYNVNTFTLDSDNDNLLEALGLNYSEADEPNEDDYDDEDEYKEDLAKFQEHFTAAQDAVFYLDGERETRSSNYIGEEYSNELIKGMTIHLTGVGEVSLEVAHDAEKAVESIQTMVDSYNSIMTWINTRMTESQVDEDTAATIDSDDFRMRWGLLHGNSLLRQTKSQMRNLISQNFVFSFSERSSADAVYGTMGFNGLRNSSTLRIRYAEGKYADLTVNTDDTLETLLEKMSAENNSKNTSAFYDIYYDEDGNLRQQPLVKFSIDDDKLSIKSTTSEEITLSGTGAMNALNLNYTYKGLYQIGLETTSDDYGKSGELVFDSSEFMEALEDNPDEVQALMLKFATQIDTWTKSMLTSSGDTSGTLTREIENLENQISTIDEYLEKYQERLDRQEETLRKKYNSTETQLSKLTQQASAIASILNQLNGTSNSSSSSTSS